MRSLARSLLFGFLALAFVGTTAAYATSDSPSERAISALKKIPNKPDTITVITIPLLVKAIQSKSVELEKEVGIKLDFIEKGVLTIHSDIMREKVSTYACRSLPTEPDIDRMSDCVSLVALDSVGT